MVRNQNVAQEGRSLCEARADERNVSGSLGLKAEDRATIRPELVNRAGSLKQGSLKQGNPEQGSLKQGSPEQGDEGLYNPDNEHDACGVGFVVQIDGDRSHCIIEHGLKVLENMRHRGAEGADNKSGDGAGILTQIPHEFILLHGIPVPERGKYGTGLVFVPKEKKSQEMFLSIIRKYVELAELTLMPIREVPVDPSALGEDAGKTEPKILQIFVTGDNGDSLERKLYLVRKRIESEVTKRFGDSKDCYIVSLSSKKIVYKGMLTSTQLRDYYTDLSDPYYTSAIALVHSRFSTNTFPRWDLAQPFRMIGHNGEINTIVGNRIWTKAACPLIAARQFGRADDILPILQPGVSDSASLDNILEFFVMSGMSLTRALAMMIPESFNDKNPISPELRGFYDYHSIFMNPWDGPAAILFSDGRYVGGMLDRNGLRPARYLITTDGMMVVASETGALEVPADKVKEKGRFLPGKILMVDTETGKLSRDNDIKEELASEHNYSKWLEKNRVQLRDVTSGRKVTHKVENFHKLLKVFGYSSEDIDKVILPMVENSTEAMGSMGDDTPLAFLSKKPQRLFNYFRQKFAQVTNPPIDPIREDLMMSLSWHIGTASSDLITPAEDHCKVVRLQNPLITNRELDILDHLDYKGFKTARLKILFRASEGAAGLRNRLNELCDEAERAVDSGCNYIIISDRGVNDEFAPIPSLLALAAIHQSLLNKHKRTLTAVIVESAEPREVMHIALLIGFGASAVCPYMAFAVLENLVEEKKIQLDYDTAEKHYIKAIDKGIKKVISKLGISTLRSYRGAQLFDSIGLSQELLSEYFQGFVSPVGGLTLDDIVKDTLRDYQEGLSETCDTLPDDGHYAFRRTGEQHAWSPEMVSLLKQAVREGDYDKYQKFAKLSDNKQYPIFLRDLMGIRNRKPIPIEEVESEESIIHHFVSGAMSFGAISKQAHELLAKAMNRIGASSNTGEGGEDPERFVKASDGSSSRSAIKQIASGRFGVNAEYLVNADEIQIKAAQGAKPGEGGQLPGYKVNELVAKTRHSIPGITLISPPPHHDIYSIEDLAQLIFDIRNLNPKAVISVKLVAGGGVGTIAAGVVKAKADKIVISGADGGTGASPLSSVRYAGMPVEYGLSEVQQTLRLNGLRGKVVIQADGELKTGLDVIVMALLGAEEYAFGTSALIAMGCLMDRRCHTNKCPVGIATQDPAYLCKFAAKEEDIENYFRFLARDVREHLSSLGFKRLSDAVGHTELLEQKPLEDKRYCKTTLERILYAPKVGGALHFEGESLGNEPLKSKDDEFIKQLHLAIGSGIPVNLTGSIHNTDRSVGTKISGLIASRYGNAGLDDDTITISLSGSAGQSFGAFLAKGVTLRLEGDANDYVGKGLSGGKIEMFPPKNAAFCPEDNTIAGNTVLYGATDGSVFINGRVGERFCVRNSGALAVAEGVGDHCCEYMTGGRVVVLGPVGRNFAAGMSGGIAYVWNKDDNFDYFCNMEMVEITLLTDADKEELSGYLSRHLHATQSPLTGRMLADWDHYAGHFLKVMPIEYKKILDEEKTIIA